MVELGAIDRSKAPSVVLYFRSGEAESLPPRVLDLVECIRTALPGPSD